MGILNEVLNNAVSLLFLIIALGVIIGSIPLFGIRLGASGVLLVALVFGHFGYTLPVEIQTIGVVLFVYSVGLQAGPYFMQSIKQSGGHFLILSLVIVASAAFMALFLKSLFNLSPSMISGLYAGAMTSTPALAAAMESVGNSSPSISYGLSYPLGILGVIFLVQITPQIFKIDTKAEEKKFEESSGRRRIEQKCYRVTNGNLTKQTLAETAMFTKEGIHIVRIKRGDEILQAYADTRLRMNDIVLAVGTEPALAPLEMLIGEAVDEIIPVSDAANSQWMMIASKSFVGKRLGNLEVSQLFGVLITRIRRGGIEMIPDSGFVFEVGDEIRVSGAAKDLTHFGSVTRQDPDIVFDTDFLSLALGLVLGVLIGLVKIPLSSQLSVGLGIAGGPLVVGLIFGYHGRFGKLSGYMPKAARNLVGELGLYMFLAVAGCASGVQFVEVFQQQGAVLIVSGLAITLFPIVMAFVVGYFIMKVNFLMLLGIICGGMTSTPSLGIATKSVNSSVPALGYAGIYPLAILFTTLVCQILVFF